VFLGGHQLDLAGLEAAIHAPEFTPLPVHKIPALVDNAEREDGRTNLDTMLIDSTDPGTDHSKMLITRTLEQHGHSRFVIVRMSPKDISAGDVVVPLTKGGVELADVSAYKGIKFSVRGDGNYRLLVDGYGSRKAGSYAATFTGDSKWKTVWIPFSAFTAKGSTAPMPLGNLRALHFELARPSGADAWLALDDIKFY
jgi:hypothetical protein